MTSKTILITRGLTDGKELREALQSHGFRVIHEPLTEIMLQHTARPALTDALMREPDAVIITSRYGARALAALSDLRDASLLCVGKATQEVAETLGFSRVTLAGQTAQQLVEYVKSAYDEGARLLYASGEHVRTDMDEALADYDVTRVVIYEAAASARLSDTLIEQLKRGQIDAVTFLSQRSAEIFTGLIQQAGLTETLATLDAYCLSDAIVEALDALGWRAIYVSPEPTLASLLATIDNASA